ncbi:MAG: outer membrane protein assembly factor BamD [Archangium sp.]|nr:outer membrane protein assembly factor BamD [Archangium sp.]MDP3152495.1 outer membrane protein assembly factor BamD [Archangium sp.]MDP3572335.1 outer membrane protein assembly factor BamD [Archangium sp.]
MNFRVVSASLALCLSACVSFGTFAGQEGGEVEFAADAETNMRKGDDAMNAKNYTEAASFFEFVKTKYVYLDLAKTAELRLADADFERERFAEARDRYQNFVRLHPTHPKVDYAAFRAALTHYKEIPSDFFLLPPASEKDQVEVRNAASAMTDFLRGYSASEYVKEAKTVLDEVRLRLAEHEIYVADFYARRDRWPAVVTRLNVVAKDFSGIGLDERVSFGLYDAYVKLKEPAKAKDVLQKYAEKFPETTGAKKALKLIAELPAAPVEAPADAGS